MELVRRFLRRRAILAPQKNSAGACYVTVAWKIKTEPGKIEKIGGKYLMTIIPGVGSCGKAIESMVKVLECTGAPLLWEMLVQLKDEKDFHNMLVSIKRNGVAILGNFPREVIEYQDVSVNMTKNMILRRKLDLHAFITEIKSFEGLKNVMKIHKTIDVTVIRQNTEGDYMLLEHSPTKNVVELLRVVTSNNTMRLAETAFAYAIKKKRKIVQCLHRAEAMPMSESLFVEGFKKVAEKYNGSMKHEVVNLKDAFQYFISDSKYLDVVVTNGLDGVMISNMLFGMLGSPHLVSGMNLGDNTVVMEAAARQRDTDHCPNPTAHFLCGARLLDYLGRTDDANVIRDSIEEVYINGIRTKDLGGTTSVVEFTEEVVRKIREKRPKIQCSLDKPPELPKPDKPPELPKPDNP